MKYYFVSPFFIAPKTLLLYKTYEFEDTINPYALFIRYILDFTDVDENIINEYGIDINAVIKKIAKFIDENAEYGKQFKTSITNSLNLKIIDELKAQGYILIDISRYIEDVIEEDTGLDEHKFAFIHYPSLKSLSRSYYKAEDFTIYFDRLPRFEIMHGNLIILTNARFARRLRYELRTTLRKAIDNMLNFSKDMPEDEEYEWRSYGFIDIHLVVDFLINFNSTMAKLSMFSEYIPEILDFISKLNQDPYLNELFMYIAGKIKDPSEFKFIPKSIDKNELDELITYMFQGVFTFRFQDIFRKEIIDIISKLSLDLRVMKNQGILATDDLRTIIDVYMDLVKYEFSFMPRNPYFQFIARIPDTFIRYEDVDSYMQSIKRALDLISI